MIPHIRVMTPADVPAGMRLKELAGWNQTPEDWVRFLQQNPEGCFVAECDGRVAGTVTTIVYGSSLAWIGMVLVDPDFRGKGVGTALLHRALEFLDARRVPCIKLDATPQGKPLYERLGFQVEYQIERRVLRRTGSRQAAPSGEVEPVEDLSGVFALDREIFGADRSAVLQSVADAAPELVLRARQGGAIEGYALGRKGSRADHLGPWIARSEGAARELLEGFLKRSRRDAVLVDALAANSWATQLAQDKGFEISRPLTRMFRGGNAHPGRPDLVCAIGGPELG
jgi:GNAT superfamily N-acetyltransferase